MNKYVVLGIFFIIVIGCSPRVDTIFLSVNDIHQNRIHVLKKTFRETRQKEYQALKKNSKQILKSLFQKMKEDEIPLNEWGVINIIDNYEHDNKWHGGVIWTDSTFYLYRYDFKQEKIIYSKLINGYSNYPKNPDIHSSVIKFWSSFNIPKDLTNLPGTGRSHNGYYIFTRIWRTNIPREIKLESYALRQW